MEYYHYIIKVEVLYVTGYYLGNSMGLFFAWLLFMFFLHVPLIGQQRDNVTIIRRHFIITMCESRPSSTDKELAIYLSKLFSSPVSFRLLSNPRSYPDISFNPAADQISCVIYGMANSDIDNLNKLIADGKPDAEIAKQFSNLFFSPFGTRLSNKSSQDLTAFFNSFFNRSSGQRNANRTYGFNHLVFPNILLANSATDYAEEYIVVVIERGGKSNDVLEPHPNSGTITKINSIAASQNSFFQKNTSINSNYEAAEKLFGVNLRIYHVLPKIKSTRERNFSAAENGKIELTQSIFFGSEFIQSARNFRFDISDQYNYAGLAYWLIGGNQEKPIRISGDTIDLISSQNTNNQQQPDDTMKVVSTENNGEYRVYSIPLQIRYSELNRGTEIHLCYNWLFDLKSYKTNQTVGFVYSNVFLLQDVNIVYFYQTGLGITIILVVIGLIVLFITRVLFKKFAMKEYLSRTVIFKLPRSIELEIKWLSISYETNKRGKLITPYCPFERGEEKKKLKVVGKLIFAENGLGLVHRHVVEVYIDSMLEINNKEQLPFDLYIARDENSSTKIFDKTVPLKVLSDNGLFEFCIVIQRRDSSRPLPEPVKMRFRLKAISSTFVFKPLIYKTEAQQFHAGPPLGNLVMAIDPGTVGSCCAIGSSVDNITMIKFDNDFILPSYLDFDKTKALGTKDVRQYEPHIDYITGEYAKGYLEDTDHQIFQSIKKLLGYNSRIKIAFRDSEKEFGGIELTYLLLKSLYKQSEEFIAKSALSRLQEDMPRLRRAIVAIPNNFTRRKIDALLESVWMLNRFIEIRYVFEAEAVLFYFLTKNSIQGKKTALIFDMGGASINATLITVNKTILEGNVHYEIDIDAKIGYAIGGDTIDFEIYRYLQDKLKNKSQLLKKNGLTLSQKVAFREKVALQIKKDLKLLGNNQEKNTLYDINFLNQALRKFDTSIPEFPDRDTEAILKEKVLNIDEPNIIKNELMEKSIFGPIQEAINQILDIAKPESINYLIVSGRSSHFPGIYETVLETCNSRDVTVEHHEILDAEHAKTAVAEGACIYGLSQDGIKLNRSRIHASMGYRRKTGLSDDESLFYPLINYGDSFNDSLEGIQFLEGVKNTNERFNFDNNLVKFYQIVNTSDEKKFYHYPKYQISFIGEVAVVEPAQKISIKVFENDLVDCNVKVGNEDLPLKMNGEISDLEIKSEHEEAYTWNLFEHEK